MGIASQPNILNDSLGMPLCRNINKTLNHSRHLLNPTQTWQNMAPSPRRTCESAALWQICHQLWKSFPSKKQMPWRQTYMYKYTYIYIHIYIYLYTYIYIYMCICAYTDICGLPSHPKAHGHGAHASATPTGFILNSGAPPKFSRSRLPRWARYNLGICIHRFVKST